MKIVPYVLKNINILNLILLAVSAGLFFALVYPLLYADVRVKIPRVKTEPIKKEANAAAEKIPTALDYVLVTEKNLFHPERKVPLEKKAEQQITRPEVIFYGAIITGEKKIAYIEDKKNPYSTPGRGKRQTPVVQGTLIGGYTLREVNPETIVLVRGDDRIVVRLRDQKDRNAAEATKGQRRAQSTVAPMPMPAPAIPAIPAMSPLPMGSRLVHQ